MLAEMSAPSGVAPGVMVLVTLVEEAVGVSSGVSVGSIVAVGSSGGVAVASAVAGRVGSTSLVASDVAVGVGRDARLVLVASVVARLSVWADSSAWQAVKITRSTSEQVSKTTTSRCGLMRSLPT
jgi:hypothetical protein